MLNHNCLQPTVQICRPTAVMYGANTQLLLLKKNRTAYNNSFRIIIQFPKLCSASEMRD